MIVFALLFGLALTQAAPAPRAAVLRVVEGVADTMQLLVGWILQLAPIGVFALAIPLASRLGLAAAARRRHLHRRADDLRGARRAGRQHHRDGPGAGGRQRAADGVALLLAVDAIPDMFRTTANVTGGMVLAAVLSGGAHTSARGALALRHSDYEDIRIDNYEDHRR